MSAVAPAVGSLTDRVQLQRRVDSEGEAGGVTHLFVPAASLWARVRALNVRQAVVEDGRGTSASHSVVVRFRTDVSAGDRFGYRGRWLEVLGAEDLNGRRAWLGCTCIERGVMG